VRSPALEGLLERRDRTDSLPHSRGPSQALRGMNIVVVVFVTFILLLSVCFELGHEHLRETTPEAFQPILTSLYSELTLLGFIGLLMFTIFKAEYLHTMSTRIFGATSTFLYLLIYLFGR
jgi:hypothetical protein